jgi:transposase
MGEPAAVVVGIAGAKAPLEVAVRPGGEQRRYTNDAAGSAALVTRLRVLGPWLIVVAATGGYEAPFVAEVGLAGLPSAGVNPRQVRQCARASGQRAKTDRLDAQVLAHCAEARRPVPRPLPEAQTQEVAALVERRRQVVALRTAEQHRLGAARVPRVPRVHAPIPAHLAW